MLGNCLWKMYTGSKENRNGLAPNTAVNEVIDAFLKAVEYTPLRKDSNRQDPVLEPINKLVSIVHKLRMRLDIEASQEERTFEFHH